jgi:integrase
LSKLTAVKVQKTTEAGRHSDGGGLYLNVTATAAKSWLFMWKKDGKRREMGLGSLKAVSLADARQRATECRKQLADGLDPINERDAKEAARAASAVTAITFEQCAEAYLTSHEAGWRNAKHRQQWRNTLATYAYPFLGKIPVAEVGTENVLAALSPIWATKTETASRVRGRIEVILDFAKVKGLRQGENPAQWRGHLAHTLPAKAKIARVEHHAALPFEEMPTFMKALEARAGIGALALRFVILTAARSGEVRLATWAEIDLEKNLWTVPGIRMKAGREHRVPLSDHAVELLEHVQPLASGPAALIFPGLQGKPLSDMSLTAALRRMKRGDLTAHGFRSTFRDWAGDHTNISREVIEAALSHVIGDKAEQAYRRGDALEKRRQLMAAWANFIAGETAGDNVVPLRATS